jgi:REP element-mobilizing transposase RayT
MPRKPRLDVPGIQHVYARGNDRRAIFRDDLDREAYLAILGRVLERMRWDCLAYCLMDNHVHLLVEIAEASLAAGIQRLHGLYGRSFNERHGRTGHLFEGRYGSKLVTSDEQLWTTMAYIVRNPVSAGLCRSPEEWRWSSHAAAMSGGGPPWFDRAALLRCFEGVAGDPSCRYAELTVGH